jgi:hypothetical protein
MAVANFMLLSRYMPEWTEDKHDNPQPDELMSLTI